ncbi:PLDc N-terminal domain-containing protein [Fibrisoma limi]|uniref:PLDc N-terminal domain-containing protein n=1 Tax=Fibrisoma limi TaxID=663275 RepID=UPI000586EDB5
MLSPNSALILWQIIVLTQLLGPIYALVQLYRDAISFKIKTVWCFVILFIPLGWIVYLIFRKQIYSVKS